MHQQTEGSTFTNTSNGEGRGSKTENVLLITKPEMLILTGFADQPHLEERE